MKIHVKQGIAILTASAMLLSGCSAANGKPEQQTGAVEEETTRPQEETTASVSNLDGSTVSTVNLIDEIKEKYADDEIYEYASEVIEVERSGELPFQLKSEVKNRIDVEHWAEVVGLYQDTDFTRKVYASYDWDEGQGTLDICPWKTPLLSIYNSDLPDDEPGMTVGSSHLFDKGEMKDWGNFGKMYMVEYYDLETGELREKPRITVVKIKGELDGEIRLEYSQTEDGNLLFTWNSVEGASKYYLMQSSWDETNGFTGGGTVIAETTETSWQPEMQEYTMNSKFATFKVSADDWYNEYQTESMAENYPDAIFGEPVKRDSPYAEYFSVIAVSEEGSSMTSNMYSKDELASMLSYSPAIYMSRDENKQYQKGILTVPSHRWIVMCDGRVSQKLVVYETDRAVEKAEQWVEYEKEDMSDARSYNVDVLYLPYHIEGTAFEGTLKITDYDKENKDGQLQQLAERQDSLRNKSGMLLGKQNFDVDAGKQDSGASEIFMPEHVSITANSRLSEYLASNLIAGVTMIDLTAFEESSDQEYVEDALFEAIYQNPLALGVSSYLLLPSGKSLMVLYEDKQEDREKKQVEILAEVEKISDDIIESGMSDIEKEIAINQYLCQTAEYDYGALENAEKNGFVEVDQEYKDSFTPYGILMNHKGVCAGYAGAFKLIADEAGLDSIVVTGYLEGSMPHAWNRVQIDGQWLTVDPTNNDNDQLSNALFNIPDYAVSSTLQEDKEFVLDKNLADYTADVDDKEYYRLQNRYFSAEDMAGQLGDELAKNGAVALRTDYDMTDIQFYEIMEVLLDGRADVSLEGYYWLGVIYLKTDSPEIYQSGGSAEPVLETESAAAEIKESASSDSWLEGADFR